MRNVRYEVWALGYDSDAVHDYYSGVEELLGTTADKEAAVAIAKELVCLQDLKKYGIDVSQLFTDGAYAEVCVETIRNDDPYNSNIETVYSHNIYFE